MNFKKSKELLRKNRKYDSHVNATPWIYNNRNYRLGGYPYFAQRAKEQYVWDIDDNKFLDFILGYGSNIIGHSVNEINSVVIDSIRNGAHMTLMSPKQLELAKKICSTCPGIETIAFLKTGSDSTSLAIRLARLYTGKKYILKFGINGWHDWCSNINNGVLNESAKYTINFEYNNLENLKSLFKKYHQNIAALIMMPYEVEKPDKNFLEDVKDLCRKNDTLFILDEIRSGFRISIGGAQKYFGVEADLVCYGKAMANGFAISAVGGKRKYMNLIKEAGITYTFYRKPEAICASLATIEFLKKNDTAQRLNSLGSQLFQGVIKIAKDDNIPIEPIGYPSTPFIKFTNANEIQNGRLLNILCNKLLMNGILMSPNHHWFLCHKMTKDDIDEALDKLRNSLKSIKNDHL